MTKKYVSSLLNSSSNESSLFKKVNFSKKKVNFSKKKVNFSKKSELFKKKVHFKKLLFDVKSERKKCFLVQNRSRIPNLKSDLIFKRFFSRCCAKNGIFGPSHQDIG